MAEISSTQEKSKTPESSRVVSFLFAVEANEKYMQEQVNLGYVSEKRFDEFKNSVSEAKALYIQDLDAATLSFNRARELVMRETGIELVKEKSLAQLQLNFYEAIGVDRYTYKNNALNQFIKWVLDEMFIGNVELIEMLRNNPKALLQIFSIDTLRQVLVSLGKSFSDFAVGDAYMRGKSFMKVAFTMIGAAGVTKLLLWIIRKSGKTAKTTVSVVAATKAEQAEVAVSNSGGQKPSVKLKESAPILGVSSDLALWNRCFVVRNKILMIEAVEWSMPNPASFKEALMARIVQSWVEKIHFSPETPSKIKRALSEIISENYPMIEIARLTPGYDILNIVFEGIKKLNDIYGQAFVDIVLSATVREKFALRFEAFNATKWSNMHARWVRKMYKSQTFTSAPEHELMRAMFPNAAMRAEFVEEVLVSSRPKILQYIAENTKKWIIFTEEEINNAIRSKFDFAIGQVNIPHNAGPLQKMWAFYQAEKAPSGVIAKSGLIEATKYAPDFLQKAANRVFAAEEKLCTLFRGRKFAYEWVQYPVSYTFQGHSIVHPKLLEFVRKGKGAITENIRSTVWEYIDALNQFDFIAPMRNFGKDYARVKAIDRDFSNGIIRVDSLTKNYKWTLSKAAFMESAKWVGMKIFIDIRDMGIMNLLSFRRLAEKVKNGAATIEELIGAGSDVTEQFIWFVQSIERKYPGVKIHLGGDEVSLMIPSVTTAEEGAKVISAINESLRSFRLQGRVAHTFEVGDPAKIIAALDQSTPVHKALETSIEAVSAGRVKPTTVHVEMNGGITEPQALSVIQSLKWTNWLSGLINAGKELITRVKLPNGIGYTEVHGSVDHAGLWKFSFRP